MTVPKQKYDIESDSYLWQVKRSTSFLLLALFLFNIAGYYGVFMFQQKQIRKEFKTRIKNALPDEDLVVFSFQPGSADLHALEWVNDHEFKMHTRLFDIVKREISMDGSLKFYCINDIQEETLFANLDAQVSNQMNSNPNKEGAAKNLLKVFKNLYLDKPVLNFILTTNDIVYSMVEDHSSSLALSVSSPPPESVIA